MKSADFWIQKLDLSPLPEEGGMYREVYRSDGFIPQSALPDSFDDRRCYSTAIYYLLEYPEFSAFHRLNQDEIWHFYDGSALNVHIIDPDGNYSCRKLGRDVDNDETLQLVIEAGCIFAAELQAPGSYALIGCTVAPGFDFADFEVPEQDVLLKSYPHHADVIKKLTR
jgi:predicted cupin superfamily sugar epimerase